MFKIGALHGRSNMESLWLSALILPWIWGAALALIPRGSDRSAKLWGLLGACLTAAAMTGSLLHRPVGGETEAALRIPWIPQLGLELVIIRDGLAAMFAVLISWISVLVTLYAWQYLPHANEHEGSNRSEAPFYALLSAFTAAMLGVVTAGNLLQLYLCWEFSSVTSYLLIGYWDHEEEARKGAFLALSMTVAGGIAMLAGFFWLGIETGHWTIATLLDEAHRWRGEIWMEGCAALILTGALAKSAQFPFSSWLPAAMKAPTPVSAFLHSSALLSAGIYLLSRFYILLHTTAVWWWLLVIPGVIGAVYCGFLAFRQEKMKSLLAYSTISQFAFMFIGFGIATFKAVEAALYAFFVHALIKAGLFMVAGSVTHVTGEKRFDKIGGLIRSNAVIAFFGLILGFSLAGIPTLGGFYYKEEFLKAAEQKSMWGLYAVFWIAGMLSLIYMLRFLYEIFMQGKQTEEPLHPVPFLMGLPIALLTTAALATAVIPDWMGTVLLNPALKSTLQTPERVSIELKIDFVFWSSVASLTLGAVVWGAWRFSKTLSGWRRRLPDHFGLGGAGAGRLYSRLSEGFLSLHTGDLRSYLRFGFLCFLMLAALFWAFSGQAIQRPVLPVDIPLTALLAAGVIISGATLFVRYHLAFVLILTMAGFAMAGAFVLMGAPNVALAQILVEILIDLSIVLSLRESFMVDPDETTFLEDRQGNGLRLAVSLAVGAVVGLGTYWSAGSYPTDAVGQWYTREGYIETGMEDFVAAILSDFRALDTLVEVLVFTTGLFAVLGLYWHERASGE